MPTNPTNPTLSRAERAAIIAEHGTFISYPKAAEITTASVRTLKRLTADGQLACYNIGRTRTLRVKTADVLDLIVRVA